MVVNANVPFHVSFGSAKAAFRWPGYAEADETHDEFLALADQWHAETGHMSLASQKAAHPAYLRIISLGDRAIPLILRDLQRRGGQWYTALRALTNEWPVPADQAGNVRAMKDAWLRWGVSRGYIDVV